jgi:hypothetical protein
MLAGEIAISELNSRVNELTKALESAKLLNHGYSYLIKLQEKFPPYTEKHIRMLEQELQLARQQLADMVQHRQAMYIEAQKNSQV